MIAYTIPQVKKKIRELINGYFCPELENKVIPPNIEEENAWEHTFSLITKNLKKARYKLNIRVSTDHRGRYFIEYFFHT